MVEGEPQEEVTGASNQEPEEDYSEEALRDAEEAYYEAYGDVEYEGFGGKASERLQQAEEILFKLLAHKKQTEKE